MEKEPFSVTVKFRNGYSISQVFVFVVFTTAVILGLVNSEYYKFTWPDYLALIYIGIVDIFMGIDTYRQIREIRCDQDGIYCKFFLMREKFVKWENLHSLTIHNWVVREDYTIQGIGMKYMIYGYLLQDATEFVSVIVERGQLVHTESWNPFKTIFKKPDMGN